MAYRLWLLAHLTGVIAFLGTFVLGLVSKTLAERSRDRAAVAHAFSAIRFGDRWIMPPAVGTMVVSGLMLATRTGLPLLGTAWILWSAILLGASGAVFVVWVNPLQKRLEQAIREFPTDPFDCPFDWAGYRPPARSWLIWASLAFAANLFAMALMVLKPDLPGL